MKTLSLVALASILALESAPGADPGRFIRSAWYEPGLENGNPPVNSRFRVNAPEAALHPSFKDRPEVRGNGMMLIRIDEDLARLAGAELYLELWGGHPHTAGKRVTINGRSTYALPDAGTAAGHCTHAYPTVPLKITDLVDGYNAIQFACDQGRSFWGHFIVDNARLDAILRDDHPDPARAGLAGFRAVSVARSLAPEDEAFRISLDFPAEHAARILRVEYRGFYDGFDENGDGATRGWHGMTKGREPCGILGSAEDPPFAIDWNVRMLPAQDDMAVKAIVRFKDLPAIRYETPATGGLAIPDRNGIRLTRYGAKDLPCPFWSRAGKRSECAIDIDEDPARILAADLHVVIWDGGRGSTDAPFALNGHALPVAGAGRHDVICRTIRIDPAILRRGENRIAVLSDTDHHGIEVLFPGPAIIVRSRGT
ncbi:MAG: hypothetical protein JXP34_20525 [Planctomycetes bacterium]|nr:hypothetical protein [Planctomycetota bacterium]